MWGEEKVSPPKQQNRLEQNGGGEWAELMMKSVVGLASESLGCDGEGASLRGPLSPVPSLVTPGFGANHFISPGLKLR